MANMYEVVEYLCKKNGISIAQMCRDTGLRQGLISDLKHGRSRNLSYENMIKIANYFEISVDVFKAGVLEETLPNECDAKNIAGYHYLLKEKPANEDDELNKPKLPSNVFPVPKMRRVPILGTIRAGMPILAEENIEGYEYADVPADQGYFYLRVKGDSMINARICEDDLVLIKQQPCADDGQIVACLVNGDEATLKRFYQQGDMVILKPENPAYNPIIVPCTDFDSGYAQILGVVTEVKFKL